MAAELIVAPEAEQDLAEAYAWYEDQRVGMVELTRFDGPVILWEKGVSNGKNASTLYRGISATWFVQGGLELSREFEPPVQAIRT